MDGVTQKGFLQVWYRANCGRCSYRQMVARSLLETMPSVGVGDAEEASKVLKAMVKLSDDPGERTLSH